MRRDQTALRACADATANDAGLFVFAIYSCACFFSFLRVLSYVACFSRPAQPQHCVVSFESCCIVVSHACEGEVSSVRLHLFHALDHISRVINTKHSAFWPFMARLEDACFLANKEDIEQASTTTRHAIRALNPSFCSFPPLPTRGKKFVQSLS